MNESYRPGINGSSPWNEHSKLWTHRLSVTVIAYYKERNLGYARCIYWLSADDCEEFSRN